MHETQMSRLLAATRLTKIGLFDTKRCCSIFFSSGRGMGARWNIEGYQMLSCPHHFWEDCTRSCGQSFGISCLNRVWHCGSSFAGHGKKSCWAVFLQHPELLNGVGRDGAIAEVEQYICHLYGAPHVTGGCDEARWAFFGLGSMESPLTPSNYTCREPITSMASGRQMPYVTGKSSRLRRMGGNKWCSKASVDEKTIGARELSRTCHLQMRH